jgi:PKD repeat protein
MKRIISTIALCCFVVCTFAQQINKGEYFFDTDPGQGNGTSLSVTQGDSVSISSSIPINALSAGFHKLVMRFHGTNNKWSMNEARAIYVYTLPTPGATLITRAECFFDTDPGQGNGTALALTSADSIMYNAAVAAGALSTGFHKMAIRFRDNNNKWSMNEARTLYVVNVPVVTAAQVTKAEYFFDTDPGQGNATAAIVATPGDSVSLVSILPATGLSVGFHKMGIRFRDSNGKWGMNEARTLYIAAPVTAANAQVTAAEYFFDAIDPGVGKATAIVGFTPGDSATISKIIVAAGLAAGQTHKLTIRVKDSKNVWGLNETRTFDVCNAPAVANFTTSLSGNVLTVTNTSTNAYGYLWKFGDDSTSTAKNTTHTYTYGGKFNVYLIAYNPCGNDTIYKTINFNCAAPYAYFTPNVNQLDVSVNNYSSGATTYSWNFGDGFTSTSSSPKHTFYATGTYSVCVTANNGCGSVSYCNNVNVTCTVPYAQFTSSVNGLTSFFNNQSTSAANIKWYFGDGGISNQLSPSYIYSNSGTYTVKLVVANACGKDSISHDITIVCNKPVPLVDFNADGLTVQFENNSTNSNSYKWNFGDGKTSTFKNPVHKFSTIGSYNVCMVVQNSCGKDSICSLVTVCTPPTADFIYSDSALTMTFTNASIYGESYYWTFGTNFASNQVNPTNKYAAPGTYNVCLNVTNSCGTDKICKNVTTSCTAFGAPQICLVTVDSLGQNNVIYWDKTSYSAAIDSFIVYREVSTNIYKPIAVKSRKDSSYFVDTVRTKYGFPLANGDPNKSTYRYKLQFKDTCGGYSALSHWHNTIYVVYNGNGQFTWNSYMIEPSTIPVSNYALLREDNSGAWLPIASTAGTQNTLSDNTFASHTTSKWRVKTIWGISCTPTYLAQNKGDGTQSIQATKTVNSSRSNIKYNLPAVGIKETDATSFVHIYPNPASNNLNIEWSELLATDQPHIAIHNYLGMEIMKYTPEKNQLKMTINISGLAAGLYFVEVRTTNYRSVKKVIVE